MASESPDQDSSHELDQALERLISGLRKHVELVKKTKAHEEDELAHVIDSAFGVSDRLGDLQWALASAGSATLPIAMASDDEGTETIQPDGSTFLSVFGRWVYRLREQPEGNVGEEGDGEGGLWGYLEDVLCSTGWHPLAADLDAAEPRWGTVLFFRGGDSQPPTQDAAAFELPRPEADYSFRRRN